MVNVQDNEKYKSLDFVWNIYFFVLKCKKYNKCLNPLYIYSCILSPLQARNQTFNKLKVPPVDNHCCSISVSEPRSKNVSCGYKDALKPLSECLITARQMFSLPDFY